jgi:RND family efflux transporter MFP subunit
MRRSLPYLLLAVVILVIGFWPRLMKVVSPPKGSGNPRLLVVNPRKASARELDLPGSVQAIWETNLSSRASGYVLERRADIGDRVQKGQVLAVIAAPEQDQQSYKARSEVEKARASALQAESEVLRSDAQRLAAAAQIPHAQSRLEQARAGVSRLQASLIQAQQAVRSRESDVQRVKAQAEFARQSLDRTKSLLADGFVTQQEVDEKMTANLAAQAQLQSAQSGVDEARAQVQAAQASLESGRSEVLAAQADLASARGNSRAATAGVGASQANSQASAANLESFQAQSNKEDTVKGFDEIRAPFTGVITTRQVEQGGLVTAGSTPLYGLAKTDRLKVYVRVPQSEVQAIKVGSPAELRIPELAGQSFPGSVAKMAGALDSSTHTRLVEVVLPNQEDKLLPGMYGRILFKIPAKDLMLLPSSCLKVDANGTSVMVVDNGKLQSRKVQLGRDLGKDIEILSGIKEGDLVLTSPSVPLAEGAAVEAELQKETPSPTPTPAASKSPGS